MPEIIINARTAAISESLEVRRILPFRNRRMVGPFIFLDHAGPLRLQPSQIATMDEMLQTWVALPEKDEEIDPTFINYQPEQLNTYTDKGIWMRLIAGEAYGLKSMVKTHSPLFYLHVKLDSGTTIELPKEYSERSVYVAKGTMETLGTNYNPGQMIVFGKSENPILVAKEDTTLMLMGGEPLGERYIWWNFVSSHRERIEQAKADWKSGKITLPPNDNKEFIPLPETRLRIKGDTPQPEALS